jgi:hypothetical protein
MKQGVLARALPTAGGMLALLIGLAAINPNVRASMAGLFSGTAWSEVNSLNWQVQDAALVVFRTMKDQSFEYGPLMLFGAAAAVLLLFMLRT